MTDVSGVRCQTSLAWSRHLATSNEPETLSHQRCGLTPAAAGMKFGVARETSCRGLVLLVGPRHTMTAGSCRWLRLCFERV